ncbi:hypothetical protein [Paenibacillus amylolyticus]|uniref:hypothetical protein n=1 Tax=Paenibacillus amylolyticus TaxID=1451 RepID=UPI003398C974
MNSTSPGLQHLGRFILSNVITALTAAVLYTILIFAGPQSDGGIDSAFTTGIFYIFLISIPVFLLSIVSTSLIVWVRDRLFKGKINAIGLVLMYLLVAIVFSIVFYFIHQSFFETNAVLGVSALLPLLVFGILYENYIIKAPKTS